MPELLLNRQTLSQIKLFLHKPSHAVGIVGETGTGKLSIAKYLVSQILNIPEAKLDSSAYIMMLDGESTGIEEVREIQKFLKLAVPGDQVIKRSIIIEKTDYLRHEATNALLKTLEEPPQDTVIFCLIDQKDSVPPTIISRLQTINILRVSLPESLEFFSKDFPEDKVQKAYMISGGSVGLLCSLLHDDSGHPLIKAISRAKEILSLRRHERLASIDKIVKDKDVEISQLLDAIFRILEANYKSILQADDTKALKIAHKRLIASQESLHDFHSNVQTKLLLTRLFMQL